jgi:hemolysin activation/secretion protein
MLRRLTGQFSLSLVALGICTAGVTTAFAQVRPNAGTLLDPQSPAPAIKPPGTPRLVLPDAKPAAAGDATVRITPSAFRFTGNSLFSNERLSELLAKLVNQPTDLAGLTAAASTVATYYRSQGYLLTEAYLPEQAFAATGGTVTIRVIEAKIGRASAEIEGDGQGISRAFVDELLASHLKKGAAVTEYALDKPILLLRDLAGFDATAIVEPGAETGEANIRVAVKSRGRFADGSVSADNHGASAAGAVRAIANVNLNNLLGRGDALSASGQISDQPGSNLFRLGYSLPVGGWGTRLGVSAARLNYALGKQFAVLKASGSADVLGFSLSQPLVRGRDASLYAQASVDEKHLLDQTANPVLESKRVISSTRLGLAGNFIDSLAGTTALNAFAINTTLGQLKLGLADQALDEGLGGLQTAGLYRKFNFEYQRTQYFGRSASLHVTLQTQLASKNLNSAEKMALGGPNGVRAYPVGEGIGDSGTMFSLEYRYQLPPNLSVSSEPVSLLTFYDYGHIRLNQNGAVVPGAVNSATLGAVGVGATLGRAGNFLIKTHLAWRTTGVPPSTGDTDTSPRAWLSAQAWF